MLGFFGVGIPKKSTASKKTDEASVNSFLPSRSERSRFLFSGRKPSNNPLIGELEENKGEETPSKQADGYRSFTGFKEGTISVRSTSQ